MEVHQPDRMLISRKVSDGSQPTRDFGVGISFGEKFLEARRSIEMQDWKCPDVAGLPLSVTIAFSGSHSGIASKVVGDKAMSFHPMRNPRRLIAIWGGIFGYRFSSYALQRVFVERQKLFKVLWFISFYVSRKIVVNPAAMAAN